ncbi:MFS general substrate transporter [Ramaria rubella]|nr:MFS general substrate transporter [Ramaria rubella]
MQEPRTTARGTELPVYTLSKWRFPGVIGLVLLNIVAGLNWPWFGSIAVQGYLFLFDFDISLTEVNWLGNVVNLVLLPCSLITPFLCKRYGLRKCCFLGSLLLVLAAWVRYAGTAERLSPRSTYALLLIGQIIAGTTPPIFQVMGPKFSEAWFDFNGRTTANMIISVANPVGSALGQLIPSLFGITRASVYDTAILLSLVKITVFLASFLVYSRPPNPPTLPTPPSLSTLRSLINRPKIGDNLLSFRTRIDFDIITFAFGSFVAAANALSLLTAQLFGPYGYTPTQSGLFAGLAAAIITAPLFDRVFSQYITSTMKTATPLLGISWLSLIWAVACELSRDAETSSAILWASANLLGVVFVLVEGALIASVNASPPLNLRKASIFVAVIVCTAGAIVLLCFRGLTDSRHSLDKARQRETTAEISFIEH